VTRRETSAVKRTFPSRRRSSAARAAIMAT
jgi:hypothetical protein